MLKINFHKPFVNVYGEQVKAGGRPMFLNEMLADFIASSKADANYLSSWELARKLMLSSESEYTHSEIETVEKMLLSVQVSNAFAAQVKILILEAKE